VDKNLKKNVKKRKKRDLNKKRKKTFIPSTILQTHTCPCLMRRFVHLSLHCRL